MKSNEAMVFQFQIKKWQDLCRFHLSVWHWSFDFIWDFTRSRNKANNNAEAFPVIFDLVNSRSFPHSISSAQLWTHQLNKFISIFVTRSVEVCERANNSLAAAGLCYCPREYLCDLWKNFQLLSNTPFVLYGFIL